MDKELIKEVVNDMIRDGEIQIVWDGAHDKYASVNDRSDVEAMFEWAEFRLEVSEDD